MPPELALTWPVWGGVVLALGLWVIAEMGNRIQGGH